MKKGLFSYLFPGFVLLILFGGGIITPLFKAEPTSIDNFDMLIISPSEFEQDLQSFVNHKESVGINCIIATIDEIINHESTILGRDDAEKMKYYISFAMEEYSISYVLLIGGKIGQSKNWYLLRNT